LSAHLNLHLQDDMPLSAPASPSLLRAFKAAGAGLLPRQAGERIITAILTHYRAEITVLAADGEGELFRVGMGNPSHGIVGVHIHPVSVQFESWELKAHKDAVAFLKDKDFNMYLGALLQALEIGRFSGRVSVTNHC
jgi:hypothetical protein